MIKKDIQGKLIEFELEFHLKLILFTGIRAVKLSNEEIDVDRRHLENKR